MDDYKSMWRAAYELHAACMEIIAEADFWPKFWGKADEFVALHNYHPFAVNIMLAVHAACEHEEKRLRGGA